MSGTKKGRAREENFKDSIRRVTLNSQWKREVTEKDLLQVIPVTISGTFQNTNSKNTYYCKIFYRDVNIMYNFFNNK